MLLETKECQRLPANYQKLREKHETDVFLTAHRNDQPHQHLDLKFLASRTVRQISIVLSEPFVVLCPCSRRELIDFGAVVKM